MKGSQLRKEDPPPQQKNPTTTTTKCWSSVWLAVNAHGQESGPNPCLREPRSALQHLPVIMLKGILL